jgi:hypothetical protein
METRAVVQLDRLDRHIWRSYVRMSAGTSRFRATSALEEAMRLADLPGEREGRHYYFRRVSLGEIPAQAGRRLWMDRVQQTLGELAATAIHGSDPRAAASNAVFFDNPEQALEALLRRSLRTGASPAWYDTAVLGDAPDPGNTLSIFRIVRRLRQSLPPVVGAAIILASVSHSSPVALLNALPVSWIRDWLREMESEPGAPEQTALIAFPGSWKDTLRLAAQEFGWKEPRTIWLAALGVMTHAPNPLVSSAAVRRARATLQWMAQEQARQPLDRGAAIIRGNGAQLLQFKSEAEEAGAARGTASDADEAGPIPSTTRAAVSDAEREPGKLESATPTAAPREMPALRPLAAAAMLGEPTAAAGLYFLLHALRQLGIADALAASPALAEAGFAAHILKRLAAHARVAAHDPIHHCLELETEDFSADGPFTDARVWPSDWPAVPLRGDGRALLRTWSLAVRRWCRRTAGVTVRDIVTRHGEVWLTRTDLDVTLPMAGLDVRIRRVGLDIDPGWVPWLGRLGRVVRFHYRDRVPQEAPG